MLLLARVVLIVMFSNISNTVDGPQLILYLLILSLSTLLGLTAVLRPYKTRLLNGLAIFHLALLLVFASSNLFVSSIGAGNESRVSIYLSLVLICFLVFLGICEGHVWCRVRKVQTGACVGMAWYSVWRKAQTGSRAKPPEREEEEWFPRQWVAKIRAENEDDKRDFTESTVAVGALEYRESRRRGLTSESCLWLLLAVFLPQHRSPLPLLSLSFGGTLLSLPPSPLPPLPHLYRRSQSSCH